MNRLITLVIFACLSFGLSAQTTLPSFFANKMVLQQNDTVPLWGNDHPNTKISVKTSWGEKLNTETDSDGKWMVNLHTPKYDGTPYTIHIKGSSVVTLSDVLVGEVWFCSGQSNMSFQMKGHTNQPVFGNNEAILFSENNQVRMYTAELSHSFRPESDIKGKWEAAHPNTTAEFNAVGYYFARNLQQVLKVPIGIVNSSWGGSIIEAWMDKETLAQFKGYSYEDVPKDEKPMLNPTKLYNAMIHPFIGLKIKGMLWYQGESNWRREKEYAQLFPTMVDTWRTQWQQGDFPFYYVQIAPHYKPKGNMGFFREVQQNAAANINNSGMVVTLDIGECGNIHPGEKQKVGERLSYWAFAKQYGISGISCEGPVYSKMEHTDDGKIELFFENSPLGFPKAGDKLTDFEIAGEDRVFHPATAMVNWGKPSITVSSKEVAKPVAVRYAWSNCPNASLYNTYGLPASSFRTDNWNK